MANAKFSNKTKCILLSYILATYLVMIILLIFSEEKFLNIYWVAPILLSPILFPLYLLMSLIMTILQILFMGSDSKSVFTYYSWELLLPSAIGIVIFWIIFYFGLKYWKFK